MTRARPLSQKCPLASSRAICAKYSASNPSVAWSRCGAKITQASRSAGAWPQLGHRQAGLSNRSPQLVQILNGNDQTSRSESGELITTVGRGIRIDSPIHTAFDGVFQNHGAGSNDAVWLDLHAIANRGVDPDEAIGTDRDAPRYDCVTGDEAIVADRDMVSNVIAAPEDDVIADLHERLNDICFEDEAVVTDFELVETERAAVDVRDQLVAPALAETIELGPDPVELAEAHGDEHRVRGRRIARLELFERYDVEAEEGALGDIFLMDGECGHATRTVLRQIDIGDLREIARAENDDLLHPRRVTRAARVA